MSLDVEYAIKKDIRNNPVVREVDRQHKRQLLRTITLAMAVVAMLVFWAWQRFVVVWTGYEDSQVRAELSAAEALHRQLLLEVESLRAPERIDTLATGELHMAPATSATTLTIEAPAGESHAATPARASRDGGIR